MEELIAFKYDENDQVFIECPYTVEREVKAISIVSDVSNAVFSIICDEIAKVLPGVRYDLECGGYTLRQCEAASLYKIYVVNRLQEGQYSTLILKELTCLKYYYDHYTYFHLMF
jgi:hypothetical protein